MARSTSTNPMRPGFKETPSIRTSESGRIRAATTRKAALDTSPGTAMRTASRPGSPAHARRQARALDGHAEGREQALRVVAARAPARVTVVTPSASRPASKHRGLHLRAGHGQVPGDGPQSSRRRGSEGGLPSMPSARAPMARSGAATRSTGRRQRDASPVSVLRKGRPGQRARPGCAGSSPSCRSRGGRWGAFQASGPRPSIVTSPPSRRTATPSAPRQARVEAQSAAEEKFVRRVWPWARRAQDREAMGERLVARPAGTDRGSGGLVG